jgi:hypothetical protein
VGWTLTRMQQTNGSRRIQIAGWCYEHKHSTSVSCWNNSICLKRHMPKCTLYQIKKKAKL